MTDIDLKQRMREHFQKAMNNRDRLDPYESLSVNLSLKGLTDTELFIGSNLKKMEDLLSISALAMTSDRIKGSIYPIVVIPSMGSETISSFLIEQLRTYEKQSKLPFVFIDCQVLLGLSPLDSDKNDSPKIPNIIKWRIQNEENSYGTKLFILTNTNELIADNILKFNEVINELASMSSDANFIIFSTPAGYHSIKNTFDEDDFQAKFSTILYFEGFMKTDLPHFKRIIESRLRSIDGFDDVVISETDYERILEMSKGIPYYTFKIIERILSLQHTRNPQFSPDDENYISGIWSSIGNLTSRQIDILTIILTSEKHYSDIKNLGDRLKIFYGDDAGARSAIIQHLTKLYEKGIIDKERAPRSKIVYYKVKRDLEPAIEFKIFENLRYM